MAFNKYKKLEQLRKIFGLNDLQIPWLPDTLPVHKFLNTLLLVYINWRYPISIYEGLFLA